MYNAATTRARDAGGSSFSSSSDVGAGGVQDVPGLSSNAAAGAGLAPPLRAFQQQLQQQLPPQPRAPQPQPQQSGGYVTSRSRQPGVVHAYEWGTEGSGELCGGAGPGAGPGAGRAAGAGGAIGPEEEEEELEAEHGELMESILEDEEEIIALHRQQIEDAMEIVRR
jgi:hypothetical protein